MTNDGPSFDALSDDALAHIFDFLRPEEIMLTRLNTKLRVVARIIAPTSDYHVRRYKIFQAMSKALPNLRQITIDHLGFGQKYADGEDANEDLLEYTKDHITRDITILSRFQNLSVLELNDAPLNGRYPFLFKLSSLQKLTIEHCSDFKWDLNMLEGLPSLKELHCEGSSVSGSIDELRVLNDTIELLDMHNCTGIEGNFMKLSDCHRLKKLDLGGASGVNGDVRKINSDDFRMLEELHLPNSVVGGMYYAFQSISDVANVMLALHRLGQRVPSIIRDCYWRLDTASPEWYGIGATNENPAPPFIISFVHAGKRYGWRWESSINRKLRINRAGIINEMKITSKRGESCEVNWLDEEPDEKSSDYMIYLEEKEMIEQEVDFFKGYHQPPTEKEYKQELCKNASTE